jgi:hypothetical protein
VGSFRLVVGDTQLDLVANVYNSLELLYYYGSCVEDAVASCIHHFCQWYVSLCYINYYSCVYLYFSVLYSWSAMLAWVDAYVVWQTYGAIGQQAIEKTPAKWYAYQIPSVIVVFVILVFSFSL